MSTVLPFTSNNITTYAYEPFSYTISNPNVDAYTLSNSKSSGIPASYLVNNGDVETIFSASSNGMTIGTQSFTVSALDGSNVVATSSNSVTIAAGRFVDSNSNSITGSNFVFYAKEAITPINLVAPFLLSFATSTPSLPPGLSFSAVNGSNISIVGTPFTTSPQSNYLLIGKQSGGGKTVSSTISIVISNERIVTNISPSDIVSGMTVGTPIVPRVITAKGNGVIRYTWNPFPTGIYATDVLGGVVSSGFAPIDPSFTLIVTGAPTLDAANAFKNAGVSNITQSIGVTRVTPAPQITSTIPVTFGFAETVLFDPVTIPALYTGVALDPTATFFRAATYFTSNVGMSNIFSPDLRPDLSLSFVPSSSRSYLVGTPTSAGTGNYTVRAVNSNGTTRDLTAAITVSNDSVTFVPPTPASSNVYTFVLSRPTDLSLAGYYPTPITFAAAAASGRAIIWSAPALTGTGLSLNVSGNTATISGTPTTVTPLQTLAVRADATGTPATATQNVQFEVINDVISLSSLTAAQTAFIQNKAITSIQLSATALSGRPVVSYSATGLPSGLTISTTGAISGTPLTAVSGSFTAIASTGFATGSRVYSYTITPDTMLFIVNPSSYTYAPSASVSIPIKGVAYSGTPVSNYAFSNFTPSYGVSIQSSTGNITGTLSDSIPPSDLLPASKNFSVNAIAGALNDSMAATLTTINPVVHRSYLFNQVEDVGYSQLYTEDTDTYSNWFASGQVSGYQWITDLSVKNTTVDSNTFLMCDSGTGSGASSVLRSTNGVDFTPIIFGDAITYNRAYKAIYVSNTWYIAGTTGLVTRGAFYTSTDDGLTWSTASPLRISPRQNPDISNYFTAQGVAFGYANGVFLIGGGSNGTYSQKMLRSTDMGTMWGAVTGQFAVEVGNFSMDGPVWVATGSSEYSSGTYYYNSFPTAADTLKWSSNQGLDWSNATGSVCDIAGYEVAYASNTWLSTGMTRGTGANVSRLLCSTDGKDWSNVTLPVTFTDFYDSHLPEISLLGFDGTNWNVIVKLERGPNYDCIIYSHDLNSSLASNWNVRVSTVLPFHGMSNVQLKSFGAQYVRLGIPTLSTFTFNAFPPGGPTVTSPTQRAYTFFQYVPIAPITFTSTGGGTIYYFVDSATLPDGLVFDPLTATISGTSVVMGSKSFIVYIKDDVGVTAVEIQTTTILPRIIRQQDGAGAYTSLVRQYTEVNAAVTARDNKALPAMEYRLGEFTAPEPPSVITAVNNCSSNC